MSSAPWNTFGDTTNAVSVAALTVQGAIGLAVGYQSVGSPHATLRETWDTLGNIKIHLDTARDNPERLKKIEAAAAMRKCKSLIDIEKEYREINSMSSLFDAHVDLSQEYAQSSYIQRHVFWNLRSMINRLDVDVNTLLMDTWTTTRAAQALALTLPSRGQDNSTRITLATSNQATSPSNPSASREAIEMAAV